MVSWIIFNRRDHVEIDDGDIKYVCDNVITF